LVVCEDRLLSPININHKKIFFNEQKTNKPGVDGNENEFGIVVVKPSSSSPSSFTNGSTEFIGAIRCVRLLGYSSKTFTISV
jgi:hypothetical protein